ncbi:MAG: VanZ family protein [Bacteroidota bacterium]
METLSARKPSAPYLFLTHWLPLLLFMGLIYYMSDQDRTASTAQSGWIVDVFAWFGIDPSSQLADILHETFRKLAHLTEYGILFILAFRVSRWYVDAPKSFWIAFAFCVLYAASDEFHQSFVVGRKGAVYDVFIDSAGAGIGWFLVRFWLRKGRKLL